MIFKNLVIAEVLLFIMSSVSDASGQSVNCFLDSDSGLYAGTTNGLILSTNHGVSWQTLVDWGFDSGTPQIVAVTRMGTIIFAAVGGYEYNSPGHGIIRSTDGGNNWIPVNRGLDDTDVHAITAVGTDIFAGTWDGGGVFRSSDSGASWTAVNDGLAAVYVNVLAATNQKLFAGTDSGLFLSTDAGTSWHQASNGLSGWVGILVISGTYMLANGGETIFLSSDGGASWSALSDSVTGSNHVLPLYGISSLANSGQDFFESGSFSQLVPGIFLSTNRGVSWTVIDSGEPDRVNAIVVSGPNLVASTAEGIWHWPLSEFNQSGVAGSGAGNFGSTLRFFPNPASNELQITGSASIGNDAAGTVHLFDLLGRERMNAPLVGNSATLDVSQLVAGMYLLRLGNETARVAVLH